MIINPLASPSAGAPALKYGDVNTETTSLGEVKGLIIYKWMIEKNNILYDNKTNLINIYYIKKCLFNMWIIINKAYSLI